MRTGVALVLVACGHPTVNVPDGARGDGAAALQYGERCGNGLDDDGDGLVDEDCQPALFTGVFAPQVASDPAIATIPGLSVIQTYHSTRSTAIASDLAAIFARGKVAHLNLEPAGYTGAQYAAPAADPLASDLRATAAQLADALAAAPDARAIVTFGAEMNGNWTDWGCLPAAQYVALYRAAHDAAAAALAARGIDPRRARWAYGPNATASANCGSAAGYYPGHAYVDLLGMSAYRSGTATVDEAVLAPVNALFDALAYPAAWREARFVLLQTGSRAIAGDDRDAWIGSLVATLTADRRVAGVIYFDAADWADATLATPLAAAPPADRALDGIFAPHFWDVPYSDDAFGEIQALADAGVTSGCATAPPRFCPDDPLVAADAAALLARAFPNASPPPLADPVTETALAAVIASLGGTAMPATDAPATRARAAYLIAHGARIQSNR